MTEPESVPAMLTIKDADLMTPAGRNELADWLRRQANELVLYGDRYSKIFRARYIAGSSG